MKLLNECNIYKNNEKAYNSDMEHHYILNKEEITKRKKRFTKPSRGTNEVRDELQSTKTLSFRCCRCCLTRGAAFTLAEVLITLGIIGIVAALVLPRVISSYQEKVLITQLEKTYSKLSNAILMAESEFGSINEWEPEDKSNATMTNMYIDRIGKYLQKTDRCELGDDGNFCGWPGTGRVYKNIDGTNAGNSVTMGKSTELTDGSYISFYSFYLYDPNTNGTQYNWYGTYSIITVDVNGAKGPNVKGKDVFRFNIKNSSGTWSRVPKPRLYPYNYNTPDVCLDFSSNDKGRGCTSWVLQYKNMDYAKCAEKMKSTNTHSCKEAAVK